MKSAICLGAALALAFLAQPSVRAADEKDIVSTAAAAGQFKTLAKLLGEAGLVDTLQGKGPFTVFTPTDAAFAKVPKETLDALLRDKEKFKAVLTYHVVPGKVMAADAARLDSAKSVQGSAIRISGKGGTVRVNDATVVKADIPCSNGVIHVIGAVIFLPAK